ncbi:MAG: hypothetical protein GVY29_10275 [Spirochaetes bacterium]|jgi:cytoskeletal protein CcmA (bactofilin family)|nr:hypothetical protein [Spirochaetota bacterium]
MKRIAILMLLVAALGFVFVACQGEEETAQAESEAEGSAESTSADATTRPTQMTATTGAEVQEAVGPDGSWIIIFEGDVTASEEIVISGEVYEEEGAEEPRRKLALYTQDSDRNVTARYTLTAPSVIVRHMNTRVQAGTISGDVFVEAEGFELTSGGTVNGNLYFAGEDLRESADIEGGNVTGEVRIGSVADAVTNPTEMTATDASSLQESLGPDGSWIVLFEGDVTVDQEIAISGAVYEEEGAEAPRRKLALYTQDSDRNVTARYTLTVPRLIVRHMNTRVQAGTIAGDVYVEAMGFELTSDATIDGDLYFASQELQESASLEGGSVTGSTQIGTVGE